MRSQRWRTLRRRSRDERENRRWDEKSERRGRIGVAGRCDGARGRIGVEL
uniref:Uncharacterized protein n=1 Tax=Cucumis melo TaxID=3656 RepID=A0A9I9DQJ4_CUCME